MKLIFSLLCMQGLYSLYARDIVVITYDDEKERQLFEKVIALSELPKDFYQFKKASKCIPNKKSLMHLCLVGEREDIIHYQKETIAKTLGKIIENSDLERDLQRGQ
jgi:hypothetical protein